MQYAAFLCTACYDVAMKKYAVLLACVIAVLMVGFIGSLATAPNIDSWYQYLDKPLLNPPNWIFGPVWTALYVLIGISLWRVIYAKSTRAKNTVYSLFGAQLALNLAWSLVFFGLQAPAWALVIIILLLFSIVMYMDEAGDYDKLAYWLFVPYVLWTGFATYLTIGIVLLN